MHRRGVEQSGRSPLSENYIKHNKTLKGVLIMQKNNGFKRIFISLLAVVLLCAVMPIASYAANDAATQIYTYIVKEMKLSPAAACGVLANIEYESDFNCNLVGDSGTSYGICQWHNERLTNLKNYCAKNGYSYKTLEGQLHFLEYELNNNKSDTGYILDKLKSVENTADGAYRAGYDWCYYFERPANRTAKSETRGNKAKNYYWPNYSTLTLNDEATQTDLGDVNKDGKVNSADALLAIEYSVGTRTFTSAQIKRADMDKDGKITSNDAFIILSISTGTDSIKNYA